MKNQKGITLVSLIITVIVMVILAAVAITALIRQDGLVQKINEAINKQDNAQVLENERIAVWQEYLSKP